MEPPACPPHPAGQQEPDRDPVAFKVSPSSGLLEARPVNAPPTSVTLHVSFTARYGPPLPGWHGPPEHWAQGPS